MNVREYLLVKLIEECQEVSQRVTKALTFGLYEKQADGPSKRQDATASLSNNARLCQEFTDLIAISEMLSEHLEIPLSVAEPQAKAAKKEKIRKYMEYSRSLGTLDKESPSENLMKILTRYEGAVNAVERDGDESQIPELEEARTELLNLLRKVL